MSTCMNVYQLGATTRCLRSPHRRCTFANRFSNAALLMFGVCVHACCLQAVPPTSSGTDLLSLVAKVSLPFVSGAMDLCLGAYRSVSLSWLWVDSTSPAHIPQVFGAGQPE
jgi:hypothetical protein